MAKFILPEEAGSLVNDNDCVWLEGSSGGLSEPGLLYACIPERYKKEGKPKNLTVVHPNGIGDKKGLGMDLFAVEGLLKCIISGHLGFGPQIVKMINDNKIEGYNVPQGVLSQLSREIAAKRPGLFTHVGLYTFADPRENGCSLNEISKKQLVEVTNIKGKEYLFYPTFNVDVVLIRGTVADENGNISMEEETTYLEMLSAAQAAYNCGGIVIAQVKRKAMRGSLDPRLVKIPGMLVDYIVIDENQMQTYLDVYDPALCGAGKKVIEQDVNKELNERKVISRRASFELRPGVINLGFGMSSEVAGVAAEEGLIDDITLTTEQGTVGGVPAIGLIFGCAYNAQALVDQPYQFDFYDGGGIDITFLGLAQLDKYGNVNVSKFGDKIAGCGGFINITQGAKKIVYCGTFTTGGLKYAVNDGKVSIIQEGKISKFVDKVEHVTFSGKFAKERNIPVTYVTERAVFELNKDGIELIEIAPGIDLERDILNKMSFKPIISKNLREMDSRIFQPDLMKIKNEILQEIK